MQGCKFVPPPQSADAFATVATLKEESSGAKWTAKEAKGGNWDMSVAPSGGKVQVDHKSDGGKEVEQYMMKLSVTVKNPSDTDKSSKSGGAPHDLYVMLESKDGKSESCTLEAFTPVIKSVTILKSSKKPSGNK